ncbi:MAG TPA: hypothetical protein ACFYED_01610 [Candidatus Tripitaka californicus]|uniref:hypothetical protein n=1 Tax=Candidatus Tripitaka californicus TaxID=3367616 RepID=UPI004025B82E|nr:hypothetical protein [Planctomycetota bacterium]
MNYSLFDEIERKDTGPEPESGVDYEYLSHSDRLEVQKICSLLEDWFSRYPKEAQDEFLERFKGVEHAKAFFELYIHEILCKQGFTCRVHPEIEGCNTHPEFLVSGKGLDFYVEATVPELPWDDALHHRLWSEFVDKLNKMYCEYYLSAHSAGTLKSRPSLKQIKNWLKTKQPDENSRELELGGAYIKITILGKKETTTGRTVGASGYSGWCQTASMIRNVIHKKATKYGNLEYPYLIAINVNAPLSGVSADTVASAFFGNLCVRINPKTGESITGRDLRTAKLLSPKGDPQNTRVSGVIILENLVPWSIAHATPMLWHNPLADPFPFPPELWQLPQQIPKEGVYAEKAGETISDLLGLPLHWPRG